MSTLTQEKPQTIPQRGDVATKDTWNLADIYASEADWEADFKKVQTLIGMAAQYAGKLAGSSSILYQCLDNRATLSKIMLNLYQYAYLNKDLDNRVSKYQAMVQRASLLSAEAGAAFSFVEPELLQMSDAALRALAGQFPRTEEYDFYIEELIRSKAHIRSSEVEELLAMSATVARGPDSIFSMLDDADIQYPTILDEKGEEVRLTKQRFQKYLESSDRRVRKDAHFGFYEPYKSHTNTLGASLAASVNKDIFYTRARRFNTCLERALDGDNIPTSVYHSLLNTTESHLESLHHYVSLRKKILKLDSIAPYDMTCPLFPEAEFEISYEDAVKHVMTSVVPLGHKYGKLLKNAFESRWVDVYETQGKGGGAYNWGNYSVHPFVLMNYNETIDAMFTLAHEMGHAMHSALANATQPYAKAQYAIFTAEVASTLNEGLLLQFMLKNATSSQVKLSLLNRYLDMVVQTYFNQVMYARFELMIHEEVERGGALSPDIMNEWWRDLMQKYLGPEMNIDELSPLKWSRIPHFYNMYYAFQYATSFAASQSILTRALEVESGLVEKYLEMLASGGKNHPIELLKTCGVDMTSPEPVMATLNLFAKEVREMEKLING